MATKFEMFDARRQKFFEDFKNDPVLTTTIPQVAAQLFFDEFGLTIQDLRTIPIVWCKSWERIREFMQMQPTPEYSVSLCGFTLEYKTEYSESDKARNIVAEMYHDYIPIFTKKDHNVSAGASFNAELVSKYNNWRTVNLTETIDMVERDVFKDINDIFGVYLMISATIFPLLAATYAAGVQVALETEKPVNMYNWFTITARNGAIILNPLNALKQGIKNDDKK